MSRKKKEVKVYYEGYAVGLNTETILSCLGNALGDLEVHLYAHPDDVPVSAAKWWIEEALLKIKAGEPSNPGLHHIEIPDHKYRT